MLSVISPVWKTTLVQSGGNPAVDLSMQFPVDPLTEQYILARRNLMCQYQEELLRNQFTFVHPALPPQETVRFAQAHESMFSPFVGKFDVHEFGERYQRNNKRGGLKNIRCFPKCENSHREQGFCGKSIYVQVKRTTSIALPKLYCWAEFVRLDDERDLEIGSILTEEAILQRVRSKQDRTKPWIHGSIVHNMCTENHLTYEFNRQRWGWHYGWIANKHTGGSRHCLRVYVFQPSSSGSGNLTLVTTFDSPSFILYCRRRKRPGCEEDESLQQASDPDNHAGEIHRCSSGVSKEEARIKPYTTASGPTTGSTLPGILNHLLFDKYSGPGVCSPSHSMSTARGSIQQLHGAGTVSSPGTTTAAHFALFDARSSQLADLLESNSSASTAQIDRNMKMRVSQLLPPLYTPNMLEHSTSISQDSSSPQRKRKLTMVTRPTQQYVGKTSTLAKTRESIDKDTKNPRYMQ